MQASGLDPTHWLAQTRLQPPLPRPDVLARPRLLDLIRTATASCQLTLISAPAGYGKTTLLGTLAAVSTLPIAWLSLDEGDGDPAQFVTAIVAALRQRFPTCGGTALSLLGSPGGGQDPRHVVGALVNDVLETVTRPSMLVLDDLHRIAEPMVYATLDALLERLPPQLHVAISTRHDPPLSLARLRARGQLAELRLLDLRFTVEEAATLLNGRLGLDLGADDVTRLHARTEGWPVGLWLLASSLDGLPSPADRSAFVAALDRASQHVFDFLAAEVLDREEPSIRRFLLETSVLPDLTPELCRAVTGRDDAATVLEDLDRRGVFVVAVAPARTAFRYHALFAEFLQRRLERELPDRMADLHRRAARATTVPGRAIGHALAAGQWEEAAGVVEQVAGPMLRDGLVGVVAGWLGAMPPTVLAGRPRLALMLGMCALAQGDFPSAQADLERAHRMFEEASDEGGAGEALGYLATGAFLQADFARAGSIVERALARSLPPRQQVQLLMTRCWLGLFRGALAAAAADLDAALALTEATGAADLPAAIAQYVKPELAALPGGLDRIERFSRLASPTAGDRVTPSSVALRELTAFVHLWRGRLDQAIQSCERALGDVERLGGHPHLGLEAAGFGAMVHLTRGEYAATGRLLDVLAARIKALPLGQASSVGHLHLLGRLHLLQGDLKGARDVWERMRDAPSVMRPHDAVLGLRLEGRLAMAERRYAAAERLLREAAALEEQVPTTRMLGTARVPLARLAYERDRPEAALAELAPVLAECEREDTPGLILVDGADAVPVLRLALRRGVHPVMAERLLALLDPGRKRTAITVPETGEVLSAREVEILDLVVAGASNRAIAERLVIAETTVKTHVANILHKLNASSRTQAAARARELGR